jgi:hypothetical protein
MRIILGAPKSTPIKEMLLELNLQPLNTRKIWLSGRYIIRNKKQPNHPMYPIYLNLRRNPTNWKKPEHPLTQTSNITHHHGRPTTLPKYTISYARQKSMGENPYIHRLSRNFQKKETQ